MDVTEKAKEVILPLAEANKEVHLNLKESLFYSPTSIVFLRAFVAAAQSL